jgi:hypothetical protein
MARTAQVESVAATAAMFIRPGWKTDISLSNENFIQKDYLRIFNFNWKWKKKYEKKGLRYESMSFLRTERIFVIYKSMSLEYIILLIEIIKIKIKRFLNMCSWNSWFWNFS